MFTWVFRYLTLFTIWAIQSGGYLGIVITMALESLMIPIPSEIILPFGGYLAAAGKLSVFGVILAGTIGGTIGSMVLYYLADFLGKVFVKKWGKYIFISERHLEITNEWFKKYGNFTVFTTRLLPIVRGIISIPAGMARMNIWSFTIYTFFGTLIWSSILTYLGFQLGLSNVGMHVVWITTFAIAGIAVVIYFISRFAKKYVKVFSVIVNISIWVVLGFFVSYALYESYSPIKAKDLNYSNILKIQKIKRDQEFSFYAVGNTFRNFNLLGKLSSSTDTSFIVDLGNMVYSGDRAKYRILVHEIRTFEKPFIAIPGPMDFSDQGYQNYYDIFGNYDYSFKVGNTYFVMLNDANGRLSPQQLNWLSHRLSTASTFSHRIVAMNIPPLWTKSKGKTLDVKSSERLKNILKTHDVDLVLSIGKHATISKSPIPYALVGEKNYLSVEIKPYDISLRMKSLGFGEINAFMEMISIYLYSLLVLEWPIIGIVAVAILMIWFFWKQYKLVFKIEKRTPGGKNV